MAPAALQCVVDAMLMHGQGDAYSSESGYCSRDLRNHKFQCRQIHAEQSVTAHLHILLSASNTEAFSIVFSVSGHPGITSLATEYRRPNVAI